MNPELDKVADSAHSQPCYHLTMSWSCEGTKQRRRESRPFF